MKHLIWSRVSGWALVPAALLAGLALGGWGPRRELDKAHAEIARLKTLPGRGAEAEIGRASCREKVSSVV